MSFRTAYAQFAAADLADNARRAAERVQDEFKGIPVAMVVYFAASNYDPDVLAATMRDAFPGAKTFGCTTAGEGVDAKLLNGSVVAMAFTADVFDYNEIALVVESVREAGEEGVFASTDSAMLHLGRKLGQPLLQLSHREYVGFILADGLSFFSETLVERVGELTDVIFAGGIAGDDCRFQDGGRVFFQGRSYRRAAVIALWKPRKGFSLLKTQAVQLTDKKLTVTKADENRRIVWEFDGMPATPAYAKAAGLPPESASFEEFDDYPLALTIDGEPFLRGAVGQVAPNGLQLIHQVREGMRFTITRFGDIVDTAAKALEDKLRETGPVAAILHVNCVSRHSVLKKRGEEEAFAALFAGIPNIAFSSYSEIYVGLVGMTSTMILFKT